jgi:Secretion system C-terminal sorting domain
MNTIIYTRRISFQLMLITVLMVNGNKATAQAKLVINGAVITISNGAALVIDNTDNTAVSRNGSGYIKSEGEGNKIIWTIGAGNGNMYLVPFGNAAGYLPLQFKAASGTGNKGQFIFSTYPTASWKNSDNLPTGVTNVNRNGIDNSAKLIDRFWQINAKGYTNKPTLNNVSFTYSDAEYKLPNTIKEDSLVAQSWSNGSLTWTDYFSSSVVNATANTITLSSIPGTQLHSWWTMADIPFPISLVNFNAVANYPKVVTSWQTSVESNSGHFEVWRSQFLSRFDSVGSIGAAGNSNSLLNYALTDNTPYSGVSYYRLKIVAADGSYKWSATVKVLFFNEMNIVLYPNPAGNYINIAVDIGIALSKPVAYLYDARGRLLRSFAITSASQQVNISSLPAGVYRIQIIFKDKQRNLHFIKQ